MYFKPHAPPLTFNFRVIVHDYEPQPVHSVLHSQSHAQSAGKCGSKATGRVWPGLLTWKQGQFCTMPGSWQLAVVLNCCIKRVVSAVSRTTRFHPNWCKIVAKSSLWSKKRLVVANYWKPLLHWNKAFYAWVSKGSLRGITILHHYIQ